MTYRFAFAAVSLLALSAATSARAADAASASSATNDQQHTEVSQVVVTAAPYAVSLDTVTSSVNVISRQQLDLAPP